GEMAPEPPVDVLSGSDFVDDPVPAPPVDATGRREDGSGRSGSLAPRINPPTDIFDVAPAVGTGDGAPGVGAADRGLVRDPIERRGPRGPSRRSLFGGPPAPTAGTPAVPDTVPAETGPGADEACTLELSAAGELIDERGTIRLAERARPSITRTPAADELVVDTGWCW